MALRDGNFCTYASDALAEMQFGLDVLEERGEIVPGSPEAEAFVNASLKAAVMHEVGHALGLRHNFRASTVYPLAKLSDPAWSRERGLARLGDGLQPHQHRRERRSPGRVLRVDDRTVRLLGDRVRVPRAPEGNGEPKSSRRSPRAARPIRCSPSRPTRKRSPASIPMRAASTWDRTRSSTCRKDSLISQELWQRLQAKQAEAGRVVRRAAPDVRRRLPPVHAIRRADREVRRRRLLRARLRRDFAIAVDARSRRRSSARRSISSRPASSRPTASGSSPSSCAAWESTTWTSGLAASTRVQSRLQPARSRARAAGRHDEHDALRRRARPDPGLRRQGQQRRPGVDAPRALRRAAGRRSGTSCSPAARSRDRAATCSASTCAASPPC